MSKWQVFTLDERTHFYAKMRQKSLFGRIAKFYDLSNIILDRFHKKTINFIKIKKGDLVVDIGCGTGEVAIHLAKKHDARFIGLDLSEDMLAVAKKKGAPKNLKFIRANASKMPFKNNSIDVIYSTLAFHHMPQEGTLKEAMRALKPGGKIILGDVISEGIFGKILKFLDESFTEGTHVLNRSEMFELLNETGFERIDARRIYGFFYVFTAIK